MLDRIEKGLGLLDEVMKAMQLRIKEQAEEIDRLNNVIAAYKEGRGTLGRD